MRLRALILVFLTVLILSALAPAFAAPAPIYVLTVSGPIEPAAAQYVQTGIATAEREGAGVVIIKLNTPGGGLTPMRGIVEAMLNANVPIIVYVSPRGAWAGSAGTFITMAANVAAMAPGTNIGSAHPVSALPSVGGEGDKSNSVETQKVVNYTAKYLAAIAKQRGRNTDWPDKAIRSSASLTADEAVKQNVVNFVANDMKDLLTKVDGMTVETASGNVTIHTKGAPIEERDMPWYKLLLHYLGDSQVAYFLMLAAIYGIIFEISNPGAIMPGVIGGISILLLLYSFSVLPVNGAGLLLILLALGLFVVDVKVPTHGVLTVGGSVAFFLGSVMLFGSSSAGVPIATITAGTLATVAFFVFLVGMGAAALKKPVVTGKQGMIGRVVTAQTDINPTGKIFTEGSWWTAETDEWPIMKDEKVKIVQLNGLKIKVVRANEDTETSD